jgi:endonuclease G
MRHTTFAAVALLLVSSLLPAYGDEDFSKCEAAYAVVGLPQMDNDGSETGPIALCRKGYAVAFNPDTRSPDWVIEHVQKAWLIGKAKRSNKFTEDPDVEPGLSATNKDYSGQGYDRGHQAPAGDFKSSQAMTDQSFLFTNMSPQVGIGFNRNIWKDLETDIRSWVQCGGREDLYVVTGPVYTDGATEHWIPKGNKRLRVPDAFFKVIYDPAQGRALGMLLPNKKLDTANLPKYAVPITTIEKQTGITFLTALSKRKQNLLKKTQGTLWGTDGSCQGAGE